MNERIVKPATDIKAKNISQTEKEERRESQSGIHYSNLHDACQRRFYFTYHLGLRAKVLDKALVQGGAFHEAKAKFYTTEGDLDAATNTAMEDLESKRGSLADPDVYDALAFRLPIMLKSWAGAHGYRDLEEYEVVAVEREVRLPIPFTDGFVHTQRHDTLLRERKGERKVFTFETKTSSSSIDFTINSVKASDQVLAYCWGGYEVFGSDYGGLVIDVTYWNSKSKNPNIIRNERTDPIRVGTHDIKVLQANLASLYNEIEAKEMALSKGTPPEFLYRRQTYYCNAYFRSCPFLDICKRKTKDILRSIPDHLEIDEHQERRLDGLTYDPIYMGEG